jgi:hypothetical protein
MQTAESSYFSNYGYNFIPNSEDALTVSMMEVSTQKNILRDIDSTVPNLDDVIFKELEKALGCQTIHDQQVSRLPEPSYGQHDDTDSLSDCTESNDLDRWLCSLDDSDKSHGTKRNHIQSEVLKPSPLEITKSVDAELPAVRKRKRARSATVKSGSENRKEDTMLISPQKPSNSAPRSLTGTLCATSRAEFEKILTCFPTLFLKCVEVEIAGLREGKERVYCSTTSRAAEHAFKDAEGRAYVYRKVVPHQHKPEKSGEPSPRCFACIARVMHEKTTSMIQQRTDSIENRDQTFSAEEIENARQVIVSALGLPKKTRVFEYETTA